MVSFFLSFLIIFWLCWVCTAAWGFSLVAASGGYSLAAVCGLLIVVDSLVAERGLWALWLPKLLLRSPRAQQLRHMGSGAPWRGGSPRICTWQADSLPQSHQGSSQGWFLYGPGGLRIGCLFTNLERPEAQPSVTQYFLCAGLPPCPLK